MLNIATIICGLFILALFLLERDRNSMVSSALWLPIVWLLLGASRSVAQWLGGVQAGEEVDPLIEGSSLDAAIFAGLITAGLGVLLARRRRARTFLRANGPLLLFFFYCAASVLWSDYPLVAFKRWTKAVGDLVMVLVVLTDPEPISAAKRLLARTGFVLIPLSILLIKYYPHLGRSFSSWTGEAWNVGVATQKNGLGLVCLIFGLGSCWYLLEALRGEGRPRSAGPLIAHGAILVMALWLFSMANSATSFGCFLLGAGLMVVTSIRTVARTPAILHLLVGLLLFVVFYAIILNPAAGLTEIVGRNSTLTGRTDLWNQLYQMSDNPWFGVGYETFWKEPRLQEVWNRTNMHVNHAHNGYLDVFLNLGLIGVALLGVVMVWGYRNINHALRWDSKAGRIKLAYFVVTAVYSLTEHGFRERNPVWFIFLLAIMVIPQVGSHAPIGDQRDSDNADSNSYEKELDTSLHDQL
jgi:O-antigen ligase